MPAERMKMEREQLVPFALEVVELLGSVKAHGRGEYVFAGDKLGEPISQNMMIYGCYRMGYRGHAERDEVRGAYNSALQLTPRRRMLAEWATLVTTMIARQEVSSSRDAGALSRAIERARADAHQSA